MKAVAGAGNILIVEDDEKLLDMLTDILKAPGRNLIKARSLAEAKAVLKNHSPRILLLDPGLPDGSGLELLPIFLEHEPCRIAIVMSGSSDEETVAKTIQAGAMEYIVKPFSTDRIRQLIDRAFELSRQCQEAQRRGTGKTREKREFIVGATPGIMEIKKYIGVLACSDSPVLISGEPGVEKIPVAKAIHARGPRGAEPFTVVECRNTAPFLIETQVFVNKPATSQSERTPETGIKCRGTLFLNDIDCLPVGIQNKLLSALRKQAERKAGVEARQDVRILSGSASKLNVLISERAVCEELLFLLGACEIHIPSLRERLGDIPLLVEAFLESMTRVGDATRLMNPAALEVLKSHPWPCNVKELGTVVGQAAMLSRRSVIGPDDLPEYIRAGYGTGNTEKTKAGRDGVAPSLNEVKRNYAREILDRCKGIKIKAAEILKVDRHTLEVLLQSERPKNPRKAPSHSPHHGP